MKEEHRQSGFVALIGRPNTGKSTLLNSLIKNKISIVSSAPQTTRYLIRGILTADNAQAVFIDSPGIHSFKEPLSEYLNAVAKKALTDIELVLYVADVSRMPALEEERIMKYLIQQRVNIIMVLNKIDLGPKYVNEYIDAWKQQLKDNRRRKDPVRYYIPVSAKTGKNIDELKKAIIDELPKGEFFYEKDAVTDFPLTYRVADVIREKLLLKLREELPHSLAVEVVGIEDRDRVVYITATVYVNRQSQKKIIIGRRGDFIKDVGIAARKDLETLFAKKVYVDIWIKVLTDWQKKMRILKELGYDAA